MNVKETLPGTAPLQAAALPEAPQPEASVPAPASVGQQLRAAREAKKMDITEVAARLKLTPHQVEVLEADEKSPLPDAVIRGFIRNYARIVALDPASLMQQIHQESQPQESQLEITVGPEVPRDHAARHNRLPVIAGSLLLLLAILAYAFPPQAWWQSAMETLNSLSNQRETVLAPASADAPEKPAEQPPAPPPPIELPPPLPEPLPLAQPPVVPAPQAPAPDARASLKFHFIKNSWVEVRDRNGDVIHSQLNPGGSVREVEGRPPFTVTIGNASQVTLEYRGQPVDLSKRSKEDVARITLE